MVEQATAEESIDAIDKFQVGAERVPQTDEFRLVSVGMVYWKNELRSFTVQDVINMGASLLVHGQIHAVVCRPADAKGLYEGV